MAISLKFEIIPSQDALSFSFRDITGVYNATSNPGGWGSPNIAIGDVTDSTLGIVLSDGSVVSLGSGEGFYPAMPNTGGALFIITNVLLGLEADQPITDFIAYITYSCDSSTDDPTVSKYVFVSSQSECCVATLDANIDFCGCLKGNCKNQDFDKWQLGFVMLKSIYNALECSPQLPNKASEILTCLTTLCANCGCNCS